MQVLRVGTPKRSPAPQGGVWGECGAGRRDGGPCGGKVASFAAGLSAAPLRVAPYSSTPRRRSFFTSPSYHRVTTRRDIAVDFEAVERNGAKTDRKRNCKLSDGRELCFRNQMLDADEAIDALRLEFDASRVL